MALNSLKLNDLKLNRYIRQIVLPEIGTQGQEKLLSSRVLVLGAGGLGSAVLYYLGASGVGTIGIVDFDKVELSNLQRQVIHNTKDLGKSKVLSAKEKINQLNPDVKVISFEERLSKSNIENVFKDFDVIIDGLDNFKDKFLINEYSVLLNKKLIHAGVVGYEGQILSVFPKQSACLRCFFPDKIPDDFRQNCKEIGVLGSCVGVLSALQATEALKLLLGIGKPLFNRILKYNALDSTFYEFKIEGKNKDCDLCK